MWKFSVSLKFGGVNYARISIPNTITLATKLGISNYIISIENSKTMFSLIYTNFYSETRNHLILIVKFLLTVGTYHGKSKTKIYW